MKKVTLLYISFLICTCVQANTTKLNSMSPMFIDEKIKKEEAEIISQARQDFFLAEQGKKPKFAKFDEGQPLLADGGTATYKGKGYAITIQKTMGKLLDISGYYYGPILKIDNTVLSELAKPISSIKFYSNNEFKKFIIEK